MTKFIDGPAAGQTLTLRRAPILLRVTFDGKDGLFGEADGQWDALNELDDAAHPGERLYAYILRAPPTMIHVCRRPGGCGFYAIAEYVYLPDQPDDATMRDNAKWAAWCESNRSQLMPEWVKPAEAK